MASVSKTELELQKATGLKPKAKEDRQAYLKRLMDAVSELSDEAWKQLPKDAATWSNDANKAFDKEQPLPDFTNGDEAAPKAPAKGKAKPAAEGADAGTADNGDAGDETEGAADAAGTGADESEDTVSKTKAAKKPAKKAAAAPKAPAKKKAAGAAGTKGDGYKGHRAGSRKEQVHKHYDEHGKDAAIKKAEKLEIQTNTARGWISSWGPSDADKGKDKPAKAPAKAKK